MQGILNTLENNHTDPSHEHFLSTMPHHTEILWEKAASRLATASCVSCSISARSIRCQIYAWHALYSKAHGKLNAYKEYRASFTSACSVMQKTANEKRKEIDNMIRMASEQRANIIKGPTFDFKYQKYPEGYVNGLAIRCLRRLNTREKFLFGLWRTRIRVNMGRGPNRGSGQRHS